MLSAVSTISSPDQSGLRPLCFGLSDEVAASALAYPRHRIVGFHTQRTRGGFARHRPALEVPPEGSHAGSLTIAAGRTEPKNDGRL
jgi:hypothetical protein